MLIDSPLREVYGALVASGGNPRASWPRSGLGLFLPQEPDADHGRDQEA